MIDVADKDEILAAAKEGRKEGRKSGYWRDVV